MSIQYKQKKERCAKFYGIYLFLIAGLLTTFSAYSDLHLVTNTNASGAGSLDAAVTAANLDNSGSVQIGFNLPTNSVISLQNPLYLQQNMIISTSTTLAPGAPNLTITNPTSAVFLAGVRPNPSASTVEIIFDGNNGSNGLIVTGTSIGGIGGGAGLGGALFVNQYTQVTAQDTQFINSGAQGGDGSPVPIATPATAGGHGGGGMLGAAGGLGGSGSGGGGGGGGLQYGGGAGGNDAGAGGGGGGGALGVPNLGGAGGAGASAAGSGGGGGGAGTISSGVGESGTGAAGGDGGGFIGGSGGAAGAGNPGGNGSIGGGGGGGGAGASSPGGMGSILGGGGGGAAGANSNGGAGGAAGGGGGGAGAGVEEFGGAGGFGSGGGGGGAGATSPGGQGGFGGGGGGGGGGADSPGGNGGFGGGGGGGGSGANSLGGLGGFGGGDGEAGDTVPGTPGGGGGGAGFGGGVFVRGNDGGGVAGTFTSTNNQVNTIWSGNTVLGGNGGGGAANGSADGEDLYLANGATATLNVGDGLSQNFATVASTRSIGGAGNIVKTGLGNLVLNAQNTYTGGTTVSSGILTLGNNSALGTGNLIMAGGALQSNVLLNNITNNFSLTASSSLIGSHHFTLSGAGALGNHILTVGNTVGTITLSGTISGDGSILQNGIGGTLLLPNANTYLGGTTLSAGALIVGNASALGTGTLTLNGGNLQSNAPLTIANQYVLTETSTINGAQNLTLSGTGELQGNDLLVNNSAGTITLSNIVSGTGGIQLNGNALLLSGANSYTGGTTINAGNLQLGASNVLAPSGAVTVNAGIFDVNGTTQTIGDLTGAGNVTMGVGGSLTFGTNTSSATFSGVMSGSGNLIKQNNGVAILTGNNTFTGTTDINAGNLLVNGALSGPLNVNAEGTLGGSGTLGGAVINNGIVSPGSAGSLESLTILGDYNVSPTATTHIVINPQGQNSSLDVQGTANLDGSLTVSPNPGSYVIGTRYTILNAGNVLGTFSAFPTSIDSLQTTVIYDPLTVTFELLIAGIDIMPSLSGGNQNQQAVGAFLNSLAAEAGSDLAVTLGALGLLSPDQLVQALESISPGRLNAAVVIAEDNDVFINKMNTDRLAVLRRKYKQADSGADSNAQKISKKLKNIYNVQSFYSTQYHQRFGATNNNFWMTPFGRFYHAKSNDIDPEISARTAGLAMGADLPISNNIIVGAGLGRYESKIDDLKFSDDIRIKTTFVTIYGTWFNNGYYVDLSMVGGLSDNNATHRIAYASVNRASRGSHHGSEIAPHLGLGKAFYFGELQVAPYVGFDYVHIREDGYELFGVKSLDMNIQNKTANAIYSEMGVTFSKTYAYNHSLVTPEVHMNYAHKRARNGKMIVSLLGQPGNFTVENFSGTRNLVSPGFNLLAQFYKGGFLRASISADFGSDTHAYEMSITGGMSL